MALESFQLTQISQAKIGKMDFFPMNQKIESVSIFFPTIQLNNLQTQLASSGVWFLSAIVAGVLSIRLRDFYIRTRMTWQNMNSYVAETVDMVLSEWYVYDTRVVDFRLGRFVDVKNPSSIIICVCRNAKLCAGWVTMNKN